ncbi:MAG: ABC transporter substrate-binding protein [Proteobacteria bacterium]|nr:ABC transporter substrate-binding protein [Pseudomonadota bacterium]
MQRILAFAVIALLGLGSPADAAESPARRIVEALHGSLLDIMMSADALGFEGRRDYITPVMEESYDMALIARASTGRYWRRASDDQKRRIIEAITRLSITIYATRFSGFSGEQFRTLSDEPAPRGTVLVKTEIVKSDGDTVALNYLMRETAGEWRIIDVYLDGIYSEIALKRADYAGILKRAGFDGLFAEIEKKIAEIEREGRK